MRRDRVVFILTGIAVGVITALVSTFVFHDQIDSLQKTNKPFDSTIWKSAQHTERNQMWFDLVSNHHLFSMPRKDLIALLGPPDREASDDLFWEMGSDSQHGPISTTNHNAFKITLKDDCVNSWGVSVGSATEFKIPASAKAK